MKLDENLPASLASLLEALGHDVHTTEGEGLAGKSDDEIWKTAQNESRFLLTQDLDFSDFRKFVPGTHHGILLVRLHSPQRQTLIARIQEIFATEDINSWPGCFVVATEHKVRVRRPANA